MILIVLILRIAVTAIVLYGVWKVFQPKWAFKIVIDESGVLSHSGISTPAQQRLLEMFQKTRFVEGRVTICGRNDENGRLQLRFYGKISNEAKQQIRNFVVNEF